MRENLTGLKEKAPLQKEGLVRWFLNSVLYSGNVGAAASVNANDVADFHEGGHIYF